MTQKENVWQLLAEYYAESPDEHGIPATATEISKAESVLNVKFCAPYKKFLSLYGGGGIMDQYIYGLSKGKYVPIDCWSIVENTQYFKKEKWPGVQNWYIIGDDGNADPFGIDKDGVVWSSYHDAIPGEEVQKVADDFEEFLYKLVTDTLWD